MIKQEQVRLTHYALRVDGRVPRPTTARAMRLEMLIQDDLLLALSWIIPRGTYFRNDHHTADMLNYITTGITPRSLWQVR